MRAPALRGLLFAIFAVPFTGGLAASPVPCAHKVKETVIPPRGWFKHSTPPSNHTIVLRIGLPQPNFQVLEKHLYEVSDPDHERYGAYLSMEQVEALVAPHQESVDLIDEWIRSHGVGENDFVRSPAKDWVTLTIPVSLAEKMLDTKYHVWKHIDSGDYIVRTTSYSLPSNLHDHIDVIQPTTIFGRFKPAISTIVSSDVETPDILPTSSSIIDTVSGVTVDLLCNTTITISCLQQLYNAVGFIPSGNNNSIGITGYLEQFANEEDLQSFYKEQRPDAIGSSFKFIPVNGGLNDQNISSAGSEANLDVQFAFGLSHPIPATFYSTAGRPAFKPDVLVPENTNEPYLEWLDSVVNDPNTPLIISTSYGDQEQTVPEPYARRICNGFAQLGARGITLLFSSGDSGVGDSDPDPATQQCFTNDGRNVTRFIPVFPSSCPFVTSVGGTANVPEVAVSRFPSGGGFSDYFQRPPYQDAAVKEYLATLPQGMYNGLYNPNGRGFPDVSAQSDNYRIFYMGKPMLIGGTSASAPTFAGIVALLNDGIGGLNDITVGHNSGCGTTGFNASKGWDPVTGLGTPNFRKLVELIASKE